MENFRTFLAEVKKLPHVKKAVVSNKNGALLANSSGVEEDGALAVFLGNAGTQIGELLGMDNLETVSSNLEDSRLAVVSQNDLYFLCVLDKKMSFSEFDDQVKPLVRRYLH